MTVNLLSKLGYYVESDSRPADKFNVQGYGESRRLGIVNDKILAILGGSASYPPPMPRGWERDSRLSVLYPETRRVIADLEMHGPWAWKAPALVLTYPFWRLFLPEDNKCIICVRNPLSVAESQRNMFGTSYEFAMTLWFQRNLAALRSTKGQERLIVHYERFFEGNEQASRIADFVGQERKYENVAEPELDHHHRSLEETMRSSKIPIEAKLLYLLLLSPFHESSRGDVLSDVAEMEDEDSFSRARFNEMKARLAAYEKIVRHPYVRLGRRLWSILERRGRRI